MAAAERELGHYDGYWKMNHRRYDCYWNGIYLKPNAPGSHPMVRRISRAGYKDASTLDGLKELTRLIRRIDRGLICYHHYSTAELETFVVDRKLPVDLSNELSEMARRKALISELEDADEDATFSRLFDLPLELRNEIYQLSMAHFPLRMHAPAKLPLARGCKQIRDEVLPIFYSRHIFKLICVGPKDKNVFASFSATPNTTALLGAIPQDNTCFLRKVEIQLDGFPAFKLDKASFWKKHDLLDTARTTMMRCRIVLGGIGDSSSAELLRFQFNRQTPPERQDAEWHRCQKDLDSTLGQVLKRDRAKRLMFGDLQAFKDVMQAAYRRITGASV